MGSAGSSSSDTLASAGPSPEDSRAMRTSGVLEFMDELDSKDTCLGRQGAGWRRRAGRGVGRGGADSEAEPVCRRAGLGRAGPGGGV